MFLFLTACSPTVLCAVSDPMHSNLLLYFMFGNDAPIESCIMCIL